MTAETKYFAEIWYALENWFQLLKGRRVLEIGYGLGKVGQALAKQGWDVTTCDPSTRALSELRERFRESGIEGVFEQAEPDKLPFATEAFDAVISVNALELTPRPFDAVREIRRVLRPKGRGVIVTFNRFSPWALPQVMSAIRPEDGALQLQHLNKAQLVRFIRGAKLHLEDVKDRACYFPASAIANLKLPVTGAFVALLEKPSVADGRHKSK